MRGVTMDKEVFKVRSEQLSKIGFGRVPDCEPSYAFGSNVLALDSQIIVQGVHADDCVYIYYAMVEKDDETLEGFFYAPSLLEEPLLNYQTYNVNEILKEVNSQINCDARYVSIGGYPMIYIPFDYYFVEYDFRAPLSDVLKIIGILDYFFTKEYRKRLQLNI